MEGDYLDSEMPPDAVAADTTTPRVFEILNIIFSLLAACFAAYSLGMAVLMPIMAKSMEQVAQTEQEAETEEIEDLKEQEAAATTEEEKAEIRTKREELESTSEADVPNFFGAMDDPRVPYYGIVDGSTGLFFNLLMFISGVGWSRNT